ncbi:MAG: hypothetical protein IKH11_08590 [Bacteroidales bacterium]|nr:hypothetical protein [Bacteroidales bacterium]
MKKYFFLLLTLATVAACVEKPDDEKPGGDDTKQATVVRVGTSTLNFEAIGAEPQSVKIYADGSWTCEAPDWVTIDPKTGSGTVTVTVSVTDNENVDGRIGTVIFAPELGSGPNVLTIQQKGDNKVSIRTGQALAEWLAGLTSESLDEARLAADIDMSGIALVPARGFSGILDGEGHAIKNLKASWPLFKVNKGTLKNIVIDESCTFVPDTNVFGAITSRNEGIVTDCVNKGSVTLSYAGGGKISNLIAGLVGMSVNVDAPLSGLKNYGKVAVETEKDKSFTSQGVAGVVAYTISGVSSCENYGEISLTGGYHTGRACPARDPSDPENIEVGEFYNKKVATSVGGVAGYAFAALDKCKNEGKVAWTETKVEGMSSSPARMFTGGVAGCYSSEVTDCSNSGEIVVNVLSSGKTDFAGQNHQQCIGGVFGGVNNPSDDAPSKNRGVNVSGCTNSGAINLEAYVSKSWIHLGGVIGWPASDNDNTNLSNWGTMSSCSNSGAIQVSGTARLRCGGVAGAPSYMDNCSNTGNITIKGAYKGSEVGGLIGRHWGYAQTVKNCSSKADVRSEVLLEGVSGFIGWIPNNHSAVIEGGSVSGSVSSAAGSIIGMLVGGFAGNSVKVTLGSSSAPIEVSGSVGGTAINAENAASLLWGAGFDAGAHSVNYVIK